MSFFLLDNGDFLGEFLSALRRDDKTQKLIETGGCAGMISLGAIQQCCQCPTQELMIFCHFWGIFFYLSILFSRFQIQGVNMVPAWVRGLFAGKQRLEDT